MNRRFFKLVILFALLHYLFLISLAGVIYLVSHVPPKAVNLDGLILALARVEDFLVAPRRMFLSLWPGESTPRGLAWLLTALNSVLWGFGLASLKIVWRKLTI